MKQHAGLLILAAALAAPTALQAKTVTSFADLGPTSFEAFVSSTDGSFPTTTDQGAAPVGIGITDPVIAGAGTTGHFIVENAVTTTGPTTTVNAVVGYAGPAAITADIDLASYVFFDVAAFGPGGLVDVRILGGGIGGVSGRTITATGSATAGVLGFVTLYATDAAGNYGSIVRTWEIPRTNTSTVIDDMVTLTQNELYRVIVRSIADVRLNNIDAFNLSAYMIVDPAFSSLTEGVDVAVSAGAAPVPLPATAWLLGSALLAGGTLGRRGRGKGGERKA